MPQRLAELIGRYALVRTPAEATALEQEVWQRYGTKRCVLVLDSQGFTRRTQQEGLVAALAAVARLRQLLEPLVGSSGGEVVKLEADNLFAVFPDPGDALTAATKLRSRLAEERRHGQPLDCCIGIDVGEILLLPGEDLFGDAVNVASKLGEDLAQAGEILVSARAYAALAAAPSAERFSFALSGLVLEAYRLVHPRSLPLTSNSGLP